MIDEVRIYDTALTAAQVQADMITGLSSNPPAVSLTASSVDFGSQPVGTTSTPVPVTVTNVGGASLTILSVATTAQKLWNLYKPTPASDRLRPAGVAR